MKRKTHGLRSHRLYDTWRGIIRRSYDENHISYKNYGKRGIIIHQDWFDVKNFINDMYPTYIEGLTIDRIDNNLGYSKDNCRWVAKTAQQRNKRILQKNNTTGYKGVSFHKSRNKFISRIKVNSKQIHLGYFETAIDAATTYDNYILDNSLEHTRNFA